MSCVILRDIFNTIHRCHPRTLLAGIYNIKIFCHNASQGKERLARIPYFCHPRMFLSGIYNIKITPDREILRSSRFAFSFLISRRLTRADA